MKRILKQIAPAAVLVLAVSLAALAGGSAAPDARRTIPGWTQSNGVVIYGYDASLKIIPAWMQPNTVMTYDESLNYTILQGGELDLSDWSRWDVDPSTMYRADDPAMRAEPNTKVEYDRHGFIQNIYYPSPYIQGGWQLSPPWASVGSPSHRAA